MINEFLDKKNKIAVIGVSENPEKYGNKVFMDLVNAGYDVYAVHPMGGEILGHKRYHNLRELGFVPDVVSVVVPPAATEKIVEECKELGVDKVWMQPGSESEKAIKFCEDNNIKVLHESCIMINLL